MEIEDLVGVRAELVLALVRRLHANGGAVCLLGDPAQAIYDFQASDSDITSAEFLNRVQSILGANYSKFPYCSSADMQTTGCLSL